MDHRATFRAHFPSVIHTRHNGTVTGHKRVRSICEDQISLTPNNGVAINRVGVMHSWVLPIRRKIYQTPSQAPRRQPKIKKCTEPCGSGLGWKCSYLE